MKVFSLFLGLSCFLLGACIDQATVLRIGMVPSSTKEDLETKFAPVQEYLARETGMTIQVEVADTYSGLVEAMRDARADIGLFGAFSYIIADQKGKMDLLVVRERKDFGVSYNSVIIVRSDSDIFKPEDLRGKSIVFVDEASTSGHLIPLAFFKSRQLDLSSFLESHRFTGAHDTSIKEVLAGRTDAAAVSESLLNSLIATQTVNAEALRVIWRSAPIPGSPFVSRDGLSRKTKEKFINAMLTLHEKAPEVIASFDPLLARYVRAERSMYDGIRNIMNVLGPDLLQESLGRN